MLPMPLKSLLSHQRVHRQKQDTAKSSNECDGANFPEL
jgi:hypothetical protein